MFLLSPPLSCRPCVADDEDFLEKLYASTRDDLKLVAGDEAFVARLVNMQRQTQTTGFHYHFPDARHWLLLRNGEPAGRLVTDHTTQDLRLVDIAIWPPCRRSGIAVAVISALQADARAHGLTMSLAVAKSNLAARQLYLRMGFQVRSEDAIVEQMGWQA